MAIVCGPIYASRRRLTVEVAETIRPIGLWNVGFHHLETPENLKSGSVNDPTRLDAGCLPSSPKEFSRPEPVSGGTMRILVSGAIYCMRIDDKKLGSVKRNMIRKVSLSYLIQRGRRPRKSTSGYKSLRNT